MTARIWSLVGVGAVGLASVGIAAPAGAAEVPGCGEEPIGGTLTNLGSVCEVDFSSVGTHSWTVPAGLTELFAVLVAGGGGAFANGTDTGYAGSGGEVIYADFSSAAAGTAVSVAVGDGGASGATPTAGGDTTVDVGSAVTAVGGAESAFFSGWCIANGSGSTYVGTGSGATGVASTNGDDCTTLDLFGVNPSSSDLDTDGVSVPSIFSAFDQEFGAGGAVLIDGTLPTSGELAGSGRGAAVQFSTGTGGVPNFNASAGSGRVILRFPALALPDAPPDAPPVDGGSGAAAAGTGSAALPDTGVATTGPIGIVALATLLGSLLLLVARRRERGAETE